MIPTAEVLAATNMGRTIARINGKISDDGGESCEARFRYRKLSSFRSLDYVEVTPANVKVWLDVDLSSYIPAGATMAILYVRNTSTETAFDYGLRCKGSTDDRFIQISPNTHTWAMVKVDSNRVIQIEVENYTVIAIYLIGYTISGVTGFTNGINYSPTIGSWQDIVLSSDVPAGAIAAIFEVHGVGTDDYGLRKNGSTDDRRDWGSAKSQFTFIIGLDANRVCEGYRGGTNISFYLLGYITSGVVMNTNATNVSLDTAGIYQEIDIGDNCAFGFFEVRNSYTACLYALRRKGDAQDYYHNIRRHSMAVVACDGASIVEGKVSITSVDFFLVGYATLADWMTTEWQNTLVTNDTYYADLTGLVGGTEYEFQTQAKNSAGEGAWSSQETFWTLIVGPFPTHFVIR